MVFLGIEHITEESMRQYQQEERSLIGHREKLGRARLKELFDASLTDELAPIEKTITLAKQLAAYHKDDSFLKITHMGKLVLAHLYKCLVHT